MKKLVLIPIFISLLSCQKKLEYIKLTKHMEQGVYDRDDDRRGFKYLYQNVLVKNKPEDIKSLKQEFLKYHNLKTDSVFKDLKIITYSTTFYEYNNSTAYFIDNNDDPGGHSSEILTDYYKENGIAEIRTTRTNNTGELKTEISFPNNETVEILK